jgi:hypothetical protein
VKLQWYAPQMNEISVKMTEHGSGRGNDGNIKDNSGPSPAVTSSGGGHTGS